ncbi:hypothetical protein G6F35_002498 [Rhizopus arrhizus]|nr:hypothetical protein G6F23_002664 [Rhizopus arrhizus]KAG0901463.1 hypothetical protein G6F34_002908 [Rhizopus arrhizus]KAG0910555.1 hypothetical protein G6F33_007786 [Rhizopus arrhizus]KAG0964849.1 hypothetical protein G6F31_006301 [Rhizopus arrhizus]KAG1227803.1 hypothetical protein G6F35_002498 [Rhizopus arrhizus]
MVKRIKSCITKLSVWYQEGEFQEEVHHDVGSQVQLSALQQLKDAGLEPVTLVDGYPTIAVAMSTKRVNLEPWRYQT